MPRKSFTCQHCSKAFFAKAKTRKYCSHKCFYAAINTRVSMKCENCGKQFFIKKYLVGKRKYCSRKCRYNVNTTCQYCKNSFTPARTNQKYCNSQCYHFSRQKRVMIHCEYCSKSMSLIPKDAKKRRYCSYSCNNKSRKFGEGNHIDYRGDNWQQQSAKARKRDNYTCQVCGHYQNKPALSVHHIIPYKEFNDDWTSANQLNNLVTLCRKHHKPVEVGLIPCPVPTET